MSQRREGEWHFDHGAQYFTARDEGFRREVRAWVEAGGTLTVLGKWNADADWTVVLRPGSGGSHGYLGFGELIVLEQADPRKISGNDYNRLR